MIERKVKVVDEKGEEREVLESEYLASLLEFVAEALEAILEKLEIEKPVRHKYVKRG